jgi:hypothetical protein
VTDFMRVGNKERNIWCLEGCLPETSLGAHHVDWECLWKLFYFCLRTLWIARAIKCRMEE